MTSAEIREQAVQRCVDGELPAEVAKDMQLDAEDVAAWTRWWMDMQTWQAFMDRLGRAGTSEALKILGPIILKSIPAAPVVPAVDPAVEALKALREEWGG